MATTTINQQLIKSHLTQHFQLFLHCIVLYQAVKYAQLNEETSY